jgi:FkbM family methyltransferase
MARADTEVGYMGDEPHYTGGGKQNWEHVWYRDGCEDTLRLDYPLTPESVVMDVGSHNGNWTAALVAKLGFVPHVYLFEPLRHLAAEAAVRFISQPTVTVLPIALSSADGTAEMSFQEWASSLHIPQTGETETITLRDIVGFLDQEGITNVDLISINIEGHEFPLLERLLDTGKITMFKDIQIQFHEFMPNAEERRDTLRTRLEATHAERYCYPFIWESWRRK